MLIILISLNRLENLVDFVFLILVLSHQYLDKHDIPLLLL
jgi:hypothetical protein